MDIKEIRTKSESELQSILKDLRLKLDDLNFKVSQGQVKNIREIRVIKKDIAKILTALKEYQQSAK